MGASVCASFFAFFLLFLACAPVFSGAQPEPGAASTVSVTAGSGSFSKVEPGALQITAPPGAAIVGSLTLRCDNAWPEGYRVPLVVIAGWEPYDSGYRIGALTIPSGSSIVTTADLSFQAPSRPGIYYLGVFFAAEPYPALVASATNDSAGMPFWGDGNDLGRVAGGQVQVATLNGSLPIRWRFNESYVDRVVPYAMVTVLVENDWAATVFLPSIGGIALMVVIAWVGLTYRNRGAEAALRRGRALARRMDRYPISQRALEGALASIVSALPDHNRMALSQARAAVESFVLARTGAKEWGQGVVKLGMAVSKPEDQATIKHAYNWLSEHGAHPHSDVSREDVLAGIPLALRAVEVLLEGAPRETASRNWRRRRLTRKATRMVVPREVLGLVPGLSRRSRKMR